LWRSLSANVFVALQRAERASFCVARAIAGRVIAAPVVAHKRGRNSYAMPASAINKARPDAATIVTGNEPIAVASPSAVTSWLHLRLNLPRQPRLKKT
jgi:hypothetical protein